MYFFELYGDPRDLHSFPARRSSDLVGTAARHGAVTVLPLYPTVAGPGVAYQLGAHALANGLLEVHELRGGAVVDRLEDRKSTRLNSSHANISYAVFCLKKKNNSPTA